jgi:hypothetical protein
MSHHCLETKNLPAMKSTSEREREEIAYREPKGMGGRE